MQVKKQQLELDMEQTGSKLGKEFIKAVYCHPAYLTSMQSTSCETLGWDKAQAGIKIARRNIKSLSYVDDTILMAENEEELKSHLKVKSRMKKLAQNSTSVKLRSWHTVSLLHGKWKGKKWKQ